MNEHWFPDQVPASIQQGILHHMRGAVHHPSDQETQQRPPGGDSAHGRAAVSSNHMAARSGE